eukprot:TRINITY_DN27932_c0_g2_i1.p1 TRINITY_DN27932_c0_g2~~TRINITY_DN27932_c0_g2_i1.p1  ORF type:complete len:211 (+),score=38.62 TRINITY_DN27932_c0_g2_i1:79-711(+)
MLRQVLLPWRALPQRALAKKKAKVVKPKKTQAAAPEVRLAPYLPPELTKETRQFFDHQARLKGLLELVFSPLEPRETEDDRLAFEEAKAEFDNFAGRARTIYEAHERQANESMWRAIKQLPEDLYDEAVASKTEKVPESLLFHVRYGNEIFRNLDDDERRKLQSFQNLMHIRYPHSDEKARNPSRFWIPENQVISRQKEAAMARKRIKKK